MTSLRLPGRGNGPVFISYHQKSGAADAEFIEIYLRSWVWIRMCSKGFSPKVHGRRRDMLWRW